MVLLNLKSGDLIKKNQSMPLLPLWFYMGSKTQSWGKPFQQNNYTNCMNILHTKDVLYRWLIQCLMNVNLLLVDCQCLMLYNNLK